MIFVDEIEKALADALDMDAWQIRGWVETPPQSEMGDYAFPCFRLAKTLRQAPQAIAQTACERVSIPAFVERIETAGGYVNFFVKPQAWAQSVLPQIAARKDKFGSSETGAGKTICIDYSSINIAKPFHVGHLLTTVIGNSLYKIFQFLGYQCVGINHLGDWGTQFGKLIVAYKRWGDTGTQDVTVDMLKDIYVRFHDEAKENPQLEAEARAWFKKIEDGDAEALSLFQLFKEVTLKEVGRVYDILGIRFDSYAGESFYNDKTQRVVDELRDKGLLIESEGAYVVPLGDDMPPCMILKEDGATLYATRDIAAALYRQDTYHFDKALYVVAYQQNLHFRQFFKVVELMGYPWAKDLVHVPFGMVSLEEGAMSTRKGNVVLLEQVLERAREKTVDIMAEKSPDLQDVQTVARQVGVGAVVFHVLYNGRIKDMVFSWDRALNFDGETGPYVQYTHARCCSVLQKAGGEWAWDADYLRLSNAEEVALCKALAQFPGAVLTAAEKYEPSALARNIMDIARAYNKFYFEHRILDAEPELRTARLALTNCTRTVIAQGLSLLGIVAPQKM